MRVNLEGKLKNNFIMMPRGASKILSDTSYRLLGYLIEVAGYDKPFTSYEKIAKELGKSEKTILKSIKGLRDLKVLTSSGTGIDTVWTIDFSPFLNEKNSNNKVQSPVKTKTQTDSKRKKKSKKTKEKNNVPDSQPKENSFKLLNTEKNKQHYRPSESTKTTAESYAEANKAKETATEKKIRQLLEGYSIKHTTQKPIYTSDSFYIVDFYLPEINLVVEVDGGYHYTVEQIEYDNKKNDKLLSLGYNVLRFSNKDYRKGWDTIREMIKNKNI